MNTCMTPMLQTIYCWTAVDSGILSWLWRLFHASQTDATNSARNMVCVYLPAQSRDHRRSQVGQKTDSRGFNRSTRTMSDNMIVFIIGAQSDLCRDVMYEIYEKLWNLEEREKKEREEREKVEKVQFSRDILHRLYASNPHAYVINMFIVSDRGDECVAMYNGYSNIYVLDDGESEKFRRLYAGEGIVKF